MEKGNQKKLKIKSLQEYTDIADILRIMSHPARLQMLEILVQQESCVQELANYCDLPHNQACEHLRLMRCNSLLDGSRKGRKVYYKIISKLAIKILKSLK